MNTRKIIVVVAIIAGLGLIGFQQAIARGWGGGWAGGCPGYMQNYQQLDEATRSKVEAFRTETANLRKEIAMKRAEKMALMNSQSPDPKAVAEVQGQLFDLRMEMQNKAGGAGVPMMGMGSRGMGMGGPGKGGMGRGMGPCCNQRGWN